MMGETAALRAAAMAVRWRNIVLSIGDLGGGSMLQVKFALPRRNHALVNSHVIEFMG
jgi:hypothetical protein